MSLDWRNKETGSIFVRLFYRSSVAVIKTVDRTRGEASWENRSKGQQVSRIQLKTSRRQQLLCVVLLCTPWAHLYFTWSPATAAADPVLYHRWGRVYLKAHSEGKDRGSERETSLLEFDWVLSDSVSVFFTLKIYGSRGSSSAGLLLLLCSCFLTQLCPELKKEVHICRFKRWINVWFHFHPFVFIGWRLFW